MDYKTVSVSSKEMGEKSDCAVKAAAIATGVEYDRTHLEFAKAGRRRNSGTARHITEKAVKALGFKLIDVTAQVRRAGGKTVRTAERVLGAGSYLVGVSGHLLCIKNGRVEDWSAGRQHRVQLVWKVVPANEQVQTEAPAQPRTEPKPAPVKPRLIIPGTARKPSVKHTIHTVANNMWEEAGKPRNVKTLLKLRKMIMDKLENEFNIKRTSASTELGQWQKGVL